MLLPTTPSEDPMAPRSTRRHSSNPKRAQIAAILAINGSEQGKVYSSNTRVLSSTLQKARTNGSGLDSAALLEHGYWQEGHSTQLPLKRSLATTEV